MSSNTSGFKLSNEDEISPVKNEFREMYLSDHSIGTLMLCLQKCLLEQSDITDILKDLIFIESDGKLFCKNPPLVKFENNEEEDE